MSCYHPNIIIQDRDRINPNTSKNWQKVKYINSRNPSFKGYEYYEQFNNDQVRNCNGRFRAIRTPCQTQCIGCCESKSKEWATKIMLETKEHKENYFITLTYDDKWLPVTNEMYCENLGKYYYDDGTWNSYLEYDHAKNFIRKVRDWQRSEFGNDGIKYYGCGEYGGKEGRAHFHIIMMGLHLEPGDVKVHSIDRNGNVLYECKKLEECWIPPGERRGQHERMGFVSVAECNWQTARYVAGYVQKKNLKSEKQEQLYFWNKEAYYASHGQTPEKCFMSNHPGIGKAFYLADNQNMFFDGYILIKGAKEQIVKAKIPRYYEKLLEVENQGLHECYKQRAQQKAENAEKLKMSQTSLSIKEQLEVEERIKRDKMLIFNLRDKATG